MLAAQTMADPHATSTTTTAHVTPPELEQTLTLLTSHRSVLGYMLLNRGQPVTIIRHSGVVFEGEQGKKYASAIARIVHSVQTGLEDVSGDHNDGDELRFMRIRTKRHEIMISPGASGDGDRANILRHERYLLAVLHDPAS
ncbi:hypothetical protein C8Q74DRAFT_1371276 [Fomes fomentarius]|nr:hypothetical protein C8Q74DRAFT_1371276 [Fomes fomentarius]